VKRKRAVGLSGMGEDCRESATFSIYQFSFFIFIGGLKIQLEVQRKAISFLAIPYRSPISTNEMRNDKWKMLHFPVLSTSPRCRLPP
jgi:hypothetical protein